MSRTQHLLHVYDARIISREELLKRLLAETVVIIASYADAKGALVNVQDFIYGGRSFIPLFTDAATGERLIGGAKINPGMGFMEVKMDYLAAMFRGPEWLIINAGDELMFEMYAHEFRPLLHGEQPLPVMEAKATGSGGRRHVLTEPTQLQIGKPSDPPSPEAILEMQEAVAATNARLVYWFWMSLPGGEGHLGLAVSPSDEAIIRQIGDAIEPIWLKHRPDNPLIDMLPLDTAGLLEVVRTQGQVLYEARK